MKNKDYNKFRRYGYPVFWIILYLIFFLITPIEQSIKEWEKYMFADFVLELFLCFMYAVIIFESGIQITLVLNKTIPWEVAPRRRALFQLVIQIITITVVSFAGLYFFPSNTKPSVDWLVLRQALVVGILFSILITALFTAEYFFRSYISSTVKAAAYQQKAALAELEALKNHIDPHFLFNNFSVLSSLIEEDAPAAVKYIAELSKVYRYVLQTKSRDTVLLSEELNFIHQYYYLYRIRYADAIRLEVVITEKAAAMAICPMTLQLLFENAVKHNTVSAAQPLIITIASAGSDSLVVTNNRNPKLTKETGAGMGLKSIQERYGYLSTKMPVITEADNTFTVKIPLL